MDMLMYKVVEEKNANPTAVPPQGSVILPTLQGPATSRTVYRLIEKKRIFLTMCPFGHTHYHRTTPPCFNSVQGI